MSGYKSKVVLEERLKDTGRWLAQVEPVATAMALLNQRVQELSREPGEGLRPSRPPGLSPEEIVRRWTNLSFGFYEFMKYFYEYGLCGKDDAYIFKYLSIIKL
jgi:hypothetical protein